MGRISAFILGFILGCLTLFFSMHYHFVHAHDGWHPIRKTTARLSDTVVDIRSFSFDDWVERPGLAPAIVQAGKSELIPQSVGNQALAPIQQSFDNVMENLQLPRGN